MKPKIKNSLKYMPTVVFCAFIFMIFILYILLPKNSYSAEEKRNLSSMPEPTADTIFNGEFEQDFETFLSDQMPMRTFFVGTNAYCSLYSGHNGSNGIYKGSDGYLFTKPVEYSELLDKNISYISEFAEKTEIPTYMCIVPTSAYIMQDKLPKNHYEYKDDELINTAKADLRKSDSNINFIDLIPSFSEKSGSEQLFYKTDHHWTSTGAYTAYGVIADSMGLNAMPKSEFSITTHNDFYGTSYAKSALWLTKPDTIELWKNKNHTNSTISVYIKDGQKEINSNSMFFDENLSTDDKYTAFLDGNHGYVKITNNDNKSAKKLLIIRDSYAHSLAPFLADNYSEITLIDLRYYKSPVSTLIKEQNIDETLILYGLDTITTDTNIAYLF
ncbi:MAG: DHHW family protein [Acutalibacteraceae bacterium]